MTITRAWPGTRSATACAVALLIAGAVYLAKGYAGLWLRVDLSDMGHRTIGLDYIRAGGTPYTVAHDAGPDAPWGWLSNAFAYWPPSPWTRPYYGLLMLATIALMAWWAYKAGARSSRADGVLFASAALAISSICTVLGLGQNAFFVVGALIGCLMLAERGHRLAAGLCLGLALAKPQIAAPFALPFLVRGEWLVLGAAAGYVAIALLLVCWAISQTPVVFIKGWLAYLGDAPPWPGYGPYQMVIDAGVERDVALAATAIAVAAAGLVVIYLLRRQPLPVLFAIAAVTGRLWSYHQLYDNAMLVFLLIALGSLAARQHNWLTTTTFVAVGATLWMPGRACDIVIFQLFQMAVWVIGTAVLALGKDEGLRPSAS